MIFEQDVGVYCWCEVQIVGQWVEVFQVVVMNCVYVVCGIVDGVFVEYVQYGGEECVVDGVNEWYFVVWFYVGVEYDVCFVVDDVFVQICKDFWVVGVVGVEEFDDVVVVVVEIIFDCGIVVVVFFEVQDGDFVELVCEIFC